MLTELRHGLITLQATGDIMFALILQKQLVSSRKLTKTVFKKSLM